MRTQFPQVPVYSLVVGMVLANGCGSVVTGPESAFFVGEHGGTSEHKSWSREHQGISAANPDEPSEAEVQIGTA
ncbi:hypothetical protein [Usitatibacter palustris]|uniref:Uncharacterized protein n=1 Tax=Usitatibacter palustris TaxID=2732487 RepID=A0A6M4H737_9PROT|nr:hypothetical protein [Usitatibacter palustris]QJR15449.1 hypothetical protein DSM104440_02270 [Usitatibacter palustris]